MAVRDARRSMGNYAVAAHAEGVRAGDERMERYHAIVGRRRTDRRVWPGAAFIVEALLLLVFLAGSLAVLMNLNAEADATGRQSAELLDAIVLASNAAEEFAAGPVAAASGRLGSDGSDENVKYADDLLLVREANGSATEAGTLYEATLTVWRAADVTGVEAVGDGGISYEVTLADRTAEPVYTLETSRYVPGSSQSADDAMRSVVLDDPAGPPVAGLADDTTDATAETAAGAEPAPISPAEGEVSNG